MRVDNNIGMDEVGLHWIGLQSLFARDPCAWDLSFFNPFHSVLQYHSCTSYHIKLLLCTCKEMYAHITIMLRTAFRIRNNLIYSLCA